MSICLTCQTSKELSECIILKCNHSYCWVCINKYLKDNLKSKIKCPQENCVVFIRDSQIRKVLQDEDILTYEKMCLQTLRKIHKCLLTGCLTSIAYTDSNTQYACPSCSLYNCIQCKAAHMFSGCEEYKRMSAGEKKNICQTEMERAKQVLFQKKGESMRELLLSLEEVDLIANNKVFECSICDLAICKGEGVKLRNCSHNICKSCLSNHIATTTSFPVKCPESDCRSDITDQEIESVLPQEELINYMSRYNNFTINKIPNRLHCKTPDCDYFLTCSIRPDKFTCEKCKHINCVKCATVHFNETCQQFQKKLKLDPSYQNIEKKIELGKLMRCPGCSTLIEKVSGCYGVQCTKCLLEICWIRRMPRWGPKGRFDTSGGCQCEVNGVRCHPKCWSCTPEVNVPRNNANMEERLFDDILFNDNYFLRHPMLFNQPRSFRGRFSETLEESVRIQSPAAPQTPLRRQSEDERCLIL